MQPNSPTGTPTSPPFRPIWTLGGGPALGAGTQAAPSDLVREVLRDGLSVGRLQVQGARRGEVTLRASKDVPADALGPVLYPVINAAFTHLGASAVLCDRADWCDRPDWPDGRLPRSAWARPLPFEISTKRLILRPFSEADPPRFAEIAGNRDVARMMINIPHPFGPDDAARWIKKRRYKGRAGFFIGIYQRVEEGDAPLIGCIGFGALSYALAYFLAPEAWGKGFASEAVAGFLGLAIPRFALPSVFAGVYHDNPASARLLSRLGFRRTGQSDFPSPARDKPEQITEWELTAKDAPALFYPALPAQLPAQFPAQFLLPLEGSA